MKLYRKDFEISKRVICLLPTIRIVWNEMMYCEKNLSISFHFLCLHARLLFLEKRGGKE